MSTILTQADHLNLIFFHYLGKNFVKVPVSTHGFDEPQLRKSIRCPYDVGKLYTTTASIDLIEIHHNHLSITDKNEPEMISSDIHIPKDATLLFIGLERIEFEDEDEEQDSYATYLLKFLMQETVCYQLIPISFKMVNYNWLSKTGLTIEQMLSSILKGVIVPIK
jgi:hypothetical protein